MNLVIIFNLLKNFCFTVSIFLTDTYFDNPLNLGEN